MHREIDRGIVIRRVPLVTSHSRNPIGRIANYLSFGISVLGASGFVRGADVVYVYATQMTAAIAPARWSRRNGLPFVLHVQDLWPESITESSMVRGEATKRVVGAILNPWLKSIYRAAAAVVAIAPSMSRMLAERGSKPDSTHYVYNWAEPEPRTTRGGDQSEPPQGTHVLSVVYSGNLGELQDLNVALHAAAQVHDLVGFELLFYGSGVAEHGLRALADSLGLTNVHFRGRIPPDAMDEVYRRSDFQLVTLKNLDIFRGTIPSKLQSSLAFGVPVLSNVAGDVADLVNEHRLGLTCSPGNVESLARQFRHAYSMSSQERAEYGARARVFYEQEMSRARAIDQIERILMDAARVGDKD